MKPNEALENRPKPGTPNFIRAYIAKHHARLLAMWPAARANAGQLQDLEKARSFVIEAEQALSRQDLVSAKKALYKARAMGRLPDFL